MDIHGVDEDPNNGYKVVMNLPLVTEGWRHQFSSFLASPWSSRC